MRSAPIYISGMGVISAMGCGASETADALKQARCVLRPISLFEVADNPPLPVGQVEFKSDPSSPLPRTHCLACIAADQALAGASAIPDAIVLGVTTGGILTTEALLEKGAATPEGCRHHGLGSVAEALANRCECTGPIITVSTACSSGGVALFLAMEMLRNGMAQSVLAGGADALSRLTYYGFRSLQLIDPLGARPLDRERRGLSLAEGAALLLLTTERPAKKALQLLGAGLSCDAHHATAPLADGRGAVAAMEAALADAEIQPTSIDYINLHGTGTSDNDLAEVRAVQSLFGDCPPPISSIKGAMGHALAAAGAIEAVAAAIAIDHGVIPANVGFAAVDPALNIEPPTAPQHIPIATVLSNSFGFGGNNAAVIIGDSQGPSYEAQNTHRPPLTVIASACLTGAGRTRETWNSFAGGRMCSGRLDDKTATEGLPPRTVRRLKRLPRLAMALAAEACHALPDESKPTAVSFGTAWGPLSETYDFLQQLFESDGKFPSPTDFVGSVHNAPAGQIAMLLDAKGANVTTSGGNVSFEQALLAADLLARPEANAILLLGADEAHPVLAPLLDASVNAGEALADGGGALVLERGGNRRGPTVTLLEYQFAPGPNCITELLDRMGGGDAVRRDYGAILVGLPAGERIAADRQLKDFMMQSGFNNPVVDYRSIIGQFGSASATAAVLAVQMIERDSVPAPFTSNGADKPLGGKGVLILGLGAYLSAVRVAQQ